MSTKKKTAKKNSAATVNDTVFGAPPKMPKTIEVLIKYPNTALPPRCHPTGFVWKKIAPTIDALHELVGGDDLYGVPQGRFAIYCDPEGKVMGKDLNFVDAQGNRYYGPIVFAGRSYARNTVTPYSRDLINTFKTEVYNDSATVHMLAREAAKRSEAAPTTKEAS